MNANNYPACLSSREGWGRFLELKRDPEPHLHQIEPTNACPFSCLMCIRPRAMHRPIGFMDLGVFRAVMDEVSTYSPLVRAKEIELFHFGESLLHPRLADMVAYASGLGLKPVLSMNPPCLTAEKAEALLAARPARIICSLDADDPELYRRLRGPAADFDLAVANLEYLLATRRRFDSTVPIVVRMIRSSPTEGHADNFRKRWTLAGAEVEIRPFFPWNDPALASLGEWERLPPHMPCPFAWRYMVVQWNGDVVPCCRDCNGESVLGNVTQNSLREIWNGRTYQDFRADMIAGNYRNTICGPCMSLYQTT